MQGLPGGVGMKGEKGIPGFPGPRVSVLYLVIQDKTNKLRTLN